MSEPIKNGPVGAFLGGKVGIVLLVCIAAQLAFIFSNSHKNADESTEQSSFFVRLYIECVEGKNYDDVPNGHIDVVTHYVRKTAHFTEYAVLGFLTALYGGIRRKRAAAAVLSPIFGFATAYLDEFSQSFADGRSNQFSDVLIDTAGSVCGAFFALLILFAVIFPKRKKNKHRNT